MKRLILIAIVVLLSPSIAMAQDFCKGDFNYNGSVAAEDVELFLEHFGRSQFNNPCPPDGPAPVARTRQTISYHWGDDADLVRGILWPMPRFTDNENGTIKDNLTGLIWLKHANCFGSHLWEQAIIDCHNLGAPDCGLTDASVVGDWRLPNLRELHSIIDYAYVSPALCNSAVNGKWSEGDPFTNVQSSYYWSSTTVADSTDDAWFVSIGGGGVPYFSKSSFLYVWCVRGGH